MFKVEKEREEDVTYSFRVSMLEIYNETVRDLLNPAVDEFKQPKVLNIRTTDEGNIVQGLTEVIVNDEAEVFEAMGKGTVNRAVGSHSMNLHSSRSHLIVSVKVNGVDKHNGVKSRGKLHLIDLAGSERIGKTDATGDRLKEAQAINNSLSALGNVINALGGKKAAHIPYRNSKLTFLLADSLGGNSKVMMFVNLSPVFYNMGESLCSLTFASRCRAVNLGNSKKNDDKDKREIKRLQNILRTNGISSKVK
jgi:kinesin family protein C2/C3